jgi:hypothetical protein
MRRAIAIGISSTLFALLGCDPEGDAPDDGVHFRQDVGYVQVRTQTTSFTAKGCDPPWGDWIGGKEPGTAAAAAAAAPSELGEKEWQAMMYTQGRMVADETLIAAFMAQPDVTTFCASSCKKIGQKWDGGAELVKVQHEQGDVEVTGECPYDMVATSIPTESVGDIACTCQ